MTTMAMGIVGRKCGMTQVFTEDGVSVPVTVIEVLPNRVTQIKTGERDGYSAVQVTTGSVHANRITKPIAGQYAKIGVEPGRGLWEFVLEPKDLASMQIGSEIRAD